RHTRFSRDWSSDVCSSDLTAVQLISDQLEQRKTALYAPQNDAMRKGFEIQLFDLTNAARVRHGRSILTWDDKAAVAARKHSMDKIGRASCRERVKTEVLGD